MIKIFCVYDSKVECYMQPFFMQTKGAALRAWESTVNDPSTQFNKHPADFTLFEIGEYDENTGRILSYDSPLSLGVAIELKREAMV